MARLVVGTFLSMDGVMQAPGGPDEDHDGGFAHGGWAVPHFDERMIELITEWVDRAGAFLLGRRTYEIFAGSWPKSTDPNDRIAVALNTRPKYVASHTLRAPEWAHTSVIQGDVAAAVARLKEQDGGEIQVHGSGELVQALLEHDLVDEFRLWTFPVVLGSGKRLFGAGTMPAAFTLTETQIAGTGGVLHVYERAGAVTYGSMEVEETV